MRRQCYKLAIVAIALVPAASAQTPAQGPSGQSGLVYDGSSSIWIDAPPRWVLDPKAGNTDGPLAVLYRQGETWQDGSAVMYVSTFEPHTEQQRTVAKVIQAELRQWRARDSAIVIDSPDNVRTVSGHVAQVRRFQSKALHSHEIVAYLQGRKQVWALVLTARTSTAFDEAYPAFLQFVKSYAPGLPIKSRKSP